MKLKAGIYAAALLTACVGTPSAAFAAEIVTSASGTSFGDAYGYTFKIADTLDSNIYQATLTNTSTSSLAGALIDALAFNVNPDDVTLNTTGLSNPVSAPEITSYKGLSQDTFAIYDVSPTWTFAAGSQGVKFDYVGERDQPADRLGPTDDLTFKFLFTDQAVSKIVAEVEDSLVPSSTVNDVFNWWLTSAEAKGTGLGGGEDIGQVAVSFQQLGSSGNDSDLLASNWEGGTPVQEVPVPGTLALLAAPLLGLGFVRRRRQ
jgi:hypothetical protein